MAAGVPRPQPQCGRCCFCTGTGRRFCWGCCSWGSSSRLVSGVQQLTEEGDVAGEAPRKLCGVASAAGGSSRCQQHRHAQKGLCQPGLIQPAAVSVICGTAPDAAGLASPGSFSLQLRRELHRESSLAPVAEDADLAAHGAATYGEVWQAGRGVQGELHRALSSAVTPRGRQAAAAGTDAPGIDMDAAAVGTQTVADHEKARNRHPGSCWGTQQGPECLFICQPGLTSSSSSSSSSRFGWQQHATSSCTQQPAADAGFCGCCPGLGEALAALLPSAAALAEDSLRRHHISCCCRCCCCQRGGSGLKALQGQVTAAHAAAAAHQQQDVAPGAAGMPGQLAAAAAAAAASSDAAAVDNGTMTVSQRHGRPSAHRQDCNTSAAQIAASPAGTGDADGAAAAAAAAAQGGGSFSSMGHVPAWGDLWQRQLHGQRFLRPYCGVGVCCCKCCS